MTGGLKPLDGSVYVFVCLRYDVSTHVLSTEFVSTRLILVLMLKFDIT